MRLINVFLFNIFIVLTCFSQVRVRGYFRKNGTYVSPHVRTYPDGILWNNYSYKGGSSSYSGVNSSTLFHSNNYLLTNPNSITSTVKNNVNKVENSSENKTSSSSKNGSKEPLTDSVKFDNEQYFQKLNKIYDKKRARSN